MEESITIGDIKIPCVDWEKTPESVKNLVRNQEQRIAAIEERLGLNASNSSIPPQSNPLKPNKRRKTKEADVNGEGKKDTKDLDDSYTNRVTVARSSSINPRPASIAKRPRRSHPRPADGRFELATDRNSTRRSRICRPRHRQSG